MRKALVIGIDHYDKIPPLFGCVNDAYSVKSVLERHSDGSVNFAVKLMTATGPTKPITRKEIKQAAEQLFGVLRRNRRNFRHEPGRNAPDHTQQ
ncbi:TPA: caspase family protein [Klebsiella pneumoniae]|nr:caspase family protein [Klebsiella pneumoniae]